MELDGSVGRDRDPPQSCKLFIGGLSYDTTDASLSRYFEKYGQVASAVVMRDAATLRSRGFGFVTFCTLKAANDVVNYPKHVVDGRKVEAKFAVPRSSVSKNGTSNETGAHMKRRQTEGSKATGDENSYAGEHIANNGRQKGLKMGKNSKIDSKQTSKGNRHRGRSTSSNSSSGEKKSNGIIPNKVFVGGLLYATGHESLRNYFEQFGEVETAEVIYNRDTKKSRGFGFVVFKTFDAVRKVLYEQENNRLIVDGKQVEVKLCMARQDSAQSLTKAMQEIDLNNNNHQNHSKSGEIRRTPKAAISVARSNAPVENRWHNKLLVASFAQAITKPVETSFSSLESPRENEVKRESMNLPPYEQPQNITIPNSDSAIPNDAEVQGETFRSEPVMEQGGTFSELANGTKSFRPRLRSPLTSPMSSPFANGFSNDSFFAPGSRDDTWGSPEQKGGSFDLSAEYDLSSSLPPLDISSANGQNHGQNSFSEFCSSPISTSSFSEVEHVSHKIDSFENHPSLFSPLSSGAQSELAQAADFSMFSSHFSNQGSFE